jgi:hypothetical protein
VSFYRYLLLGTKNRKIVIGVFMRFICSAFMRENECYALNRSASILIPFGTTLMAQRNGGSDALSLTTDMWVRVYWNAYLV